MKFFPRLFKKYVPDCHEEIHNPPTGLYWVELVDDNAEDYNRELYGFILLLWFLVCIAYGIYAYNKYTRVDCNFQPIGSISDRVDTVRMSNGYWYVQKIEGNSNAFVHGLISTDGQFIKRSDLPLVPLWAGIAAFIAMGIFKKQERKVIFPTP